MLLSRLAIPALALLAASPAAAQGLGLFDSSPDQLKRYTDCMALARSEPVKALPVAEKWQASGGGLPARHCVALALFEEIVPASESWYISRTGTRWTGMSAPSASPMRTSRS